MKIYQIYGNMKKIKHGKQKAQGRQKAQVVPVWVNGPKCQHLKLTLGDRINDKG